MILWSMESRNTNISLESIRFPSTHFWLLVGKKPKAQAGEAASIRKEWAFMFGVWMFACDKEAWSCLEKELRERGEQSSHTIRGPGVEPRRAVKFWKCKTGQKTWLRWGWDDNRERLVPHIAFEMSQRNLQAAGAQSRWNKDAALKLKDCGRLFLWATGNFTNAKESLESDEICNREKSRLVWWQGYFSRKDETVKGRQC